MARDALTLARQIGDPALIASGLLAIGTTVVQTDPEQARAYLRESLELSTALGFQTPSTWPGPPRSHSSSTTGPPPLSSATVPSPASNGVVTASY